MTSRATRFAKAMDDVRTAKDELEELRDELQTWLDNMPDNLQSSAKADELQEAIDGLEEIMESLDAVEGCDVVFPGMWVWLQFVGRGLAPSSDVASDVPRTAPRRARPCVFSRG